MLAAQHPSPQIRLINLFMPPSNDPLLTPYKKQLNPKILPIKRSLSILSNLKEHPTVNQPKIQLNFKDFAKINRSYQSLKKFKKKFIHNLEKSDTPFQCEKDPQYLRLIQIRKSMLKKRLCQENKMAHSLTILSLKDKKCSLQGITQSQGIRTNPYGFQRYFEEKQGRNKKNVQRQKKDQQIIRVFSAKQRSKF